MSVKVNNSRESLFPIDKSTLTTHSIITSRECYAREISGFYDLEPGTTHHQSYLRTFRDLQRILPAPGKAR